MTTFKDLMTRYDHYKETSVSRSFPTRAMVNLATYMEIKLDFAHRCYPDNPDLVWEFMQVEWEKVGFPIEIDPGLKDGEIIMDRG